MKKIILSIAAVAALAACTKSEVQYEQPGEIGFVPVTKMNTKAAVADNKYPEGLDLFIFANAGDPNAEVSAYTPYFRNGQFKHTEDGVFSGQPTPYYWPNVKKLIFSGYSNSGNVSDVSTTNPRYEYFPGDANTTPKKPAEWQIKLDEYAPGAGTLAKGDNDLMWFPTTVPYAKPGIIGTDNDKDVNVQMKHACSWITFNVKGNEVTGRADDESTEDVNEGTTWKVLDIKIKEVAQSGNVTLGANATWVPSVTTPDLPVFAGSKALTNDFVDYTQLTYKDLVVIPQATKQLYIKYQYVSQKGAADDGSQDLICTEEITKPLTYTDGTNWLPGVHYIYNITIGTEEILIEPTVAEWEPKNNEGNLADNGLNSDITL